VSYAWVDHTGELELAIEAGSEEAVFGEAVRAVRELLSSGAGAAARREVTVEAPDRAALLAAFLDELVFLAETEGLVPERLVDLRLGGQRLETEVQGRLSDPPHLIKGVTYHRLALERDGSGWTARVVFDV
jgi:SHS2 domain-containing protein